MKILIYNSGGGLGDSIQLFDIINSLKKKFGTNSIFYLSSHKNHFNNSLKDYNIPLNELNTDIIYFGFRIWHLFCSKKKILNKNSIDNFDLIIDLQSKLRNTLILKQIPTKKFYSPTFNFKFSSENRNFISTKYNNINILKNLEKLLDTEISLIKYDIKSIEKKFFDEANRLLPKNNYVGFSITQGNEYRKKTWSVGKFISIAKKLKEFNKQPVFFVEKKYSQLINKIKMEVENVIFPELESHLSGPPLVTALSSKLEKAITIDNGVMHMMSLANIPMVILFGPTNSKKFAPKKNNINILDSKILYNSKDISKITEEDVLNLI